jgi:hypothetical protein
MFCIVIPTPLLILVTRLELALPVPDPHPCSARFLLIRSSGLLEYPHPIA